jgi:hypothetical protein
MVTEQRRLKHNEYMRGWKRRNKAKVNEWNQQWKDNNRELVRRREKDRARYRALTEDGYRALWLNNIKHRAKKRGLAFDLTVEDLPMPKRCPIFGIQLQYHQGKFQDTSPSIDRINPAKGYVKGNVQIVSYKANRIKGPYTLKELKKIVAFLERHW